MKKTLRILTAMVLTVFMVMSVSMTAFAADTYSIRMKRAPKDRAAHTYEAYQVFKGDLSDGKMINIEWGEGVNGANLLTALKNKNILTMQNLLLAALLLMLQRFWLRIMDWTTMRQRILLHW